MLFSILKKLQNQNSLAYFNLGVQVASRSSGPKRKKQYCPFCNKQQSRLSRHILTHKEEHEVNKYIACSDQLIKSKMMAKFRNLGNHIHNVKTINMGKGELNVVYRPENKCDLSRYVPCSYCYGYYSKPDLWRHVLRCPMNNSPTKAKGQRHVAKGKLLFPIKKCSNKLREVLATMNDGPVSAKVRNDPLLMKLGEELVLKHAHDRHQFQHIRSVLRELGRLLLCSKAQSMEDLIDPGQFRRVITSAKTLAGFDAETNSFKVPSLVLSLSASLKKCAALLEADAMQRYETSLCQRAQNFCRLIATRWTIELAANARRTLQESKRNKVKLLPLTADIQLLSAHLKHKISYYRATLQQCNTDTTAYDNLKKSLLAMLILFNRRRSGEMSRMTLSEYYGVHTSSAAMQDDIGLTEMEKSLSQCLRRVEIRGKRGRNVPVLLTKLMSESLDLLVTCRESAGVSRENKYIFSNNSPDGCIRGCDVLREFSMACGASNPETLRSTRLRKHIATITQIANLKRNELDMLAKFMGHDVEIHREFYRLPEETTQLAKVSKLLYALDTGKVSSLVGKKLSEIEIDPNEEVEGKDKYKIQIENC